MAILTILQYPDSRLYRKGLTVADVHAAPIQKIIRDMLETLANVEGSAAALAATQLDIENPPAITVINSLDDTNKVLCLINPQIIYKYGIIAEEEGCMSILPGTISAKVKRAAKIKVKALNPSGQHIEFEAENYLAKCIQHECDHLNGIIYLDHLSKLKRLFIDKKIAKLLRHKKTC